MAPTDYDSDDEGQELRTDEYGDRFEDYGFIKRAEEHKLMGNADFQKERFEKALKEYECAHDQLLTVAHDKSIVIGKRKWNDVVVMRAMIHLNKSACHYKLKNWSPAADAAQECLMGNVREEMMYTDPTIRAKVKAAEKSHGKSEVAFLEEKLPKGTRSKAWFRLSRCYANLGHLDRAKEALAKAMEHCEDKQTLAEMNQHALRVDTLEKQQKQKQKQQFKGFFEKLQDRGGYVDAKTATKAKWDTLDYNTKLRLIEELDDSDGDDEVLMPVAELLAAGAPQGTAEAIVSAAKQAEEGDEAAHALEDAENLAIKANTLYAAEDIAAYRQSDSQRREKQWRQRTKQQEMDELEEDELKKARERLARRKQGANKKIHDSDAD